MTKKEKVKALFVYYFSEILHHTSWDKDRLVDECVTKINEIYNDKQ